MPNRHTKSKPEKPAANAEQSSSPKILAPLIIGALGIVFGDIGTSPLYTIQVCFSQRSGVAANPANVIGVISLIIWSLVIIVSIKYLIVILQADLNGEGGILALTTLVNPKRSKTSSNSWLLPLGLFGAALLLGDSMITPAISVLSAVEGVEVLQPSLTSYVVPICIAILVGLFLIQQHGTERIGKFFGPVMLCWFMTIALLGIHGIVQSPQILKALDPTQGIRLLLSHPSQSVLLLGFVFLAVTGGEALYADLGHFGRLPIRIGWFVVAFPALVLNYLGQGALLLSDPKAADYPFFRLAPHWAQYPLVALATLATVIASQAVISGSFSLLHQARQLGYAPRIKVEHYSTDGEGKVYVPLVNWCLAIATILLVIFFRSSDALAGAYGMAVAGTMIITTILVVVCFRRNWKWSWPATILVAAAFLSVDSIFFLANLAKFFDGGWLPLSVAATIYLVMDTWRRGRRLLQASRCDTKTSLDDLLHQVKTGDLIMVPGTAVYFTSDPDVIPITLLVNAKHNHILHEQIVFVTISTEQLPRIGAADRLEVAHPAPGFVRLVAHYGFMQTPHMPSLIKLAIQQEVFDDDSQFTYFVRSEEISLTREKNMFRWRKRFYALLNRNSQDATGLWSIPISQVVGIRLSTDL